MLRNRMIQYHNKIYDFSSKIENKALHLALVGVKVFDYDIENKALHLTLFWSWSV